MAATIPCLYAMLESGPCRSVLLTAKVLGVKLNVKSIDLVQNEQFKPEFLKMNPEHTVPVLTDGENFVLSESRAIMIYLAEKYATPKINLYPSDIKIRAHINQRLHFDNAILYTPIYNYYRVIYFGNKSYNESLMPHIKRAFKYLNIFLENGKYTVGDKLTIADIAMTSSVATATTVFDFDLNPYENVYKWFDFMKRTLPGYQDIIEMNAQKNKMLVEAFKTINNS